ncbi:MAG: diaminobutyrate--2-oxoglutarate transaminase [Burkholderiaceae bacterium]|nr:diaminobutyrate--2-oxoglutarate transaminase [Microbacteriaceae bacterium]
MSGLVVRRPVIDDGADAWGIARDSGTLDLNSSYAYLLYFRDFAETCRVAVVDGVVAGFLMGNRPPERPETLFVWQIAVDERFRGRGIAGLMLDDLAADPTLSPPVTMIETTITDDNPASQALFRAFAKRRGDSPLTVTPLLEATHFPDGHHAEPLYTIGPLGAPTPNPTEDHQMTTTTIDLESQVRSYSRSWPVVFDRAVGSTMFAEDGTPYLDFFAGAGALNYGHNNPRLKKVVVDYFTDDRVTHSLDMFTTARRDFLETFHSHILEPRGLDYTMIFPGPGGANSVEAALKLARKVTGRESVINFTNAFHGMTLGALAVTGNSLKRGGAGVPLVHATPMPYDDYFNGDYPDFLYFEKLLDDSGSGLNKPAAVIVESVQGEGGINVARAEWLRGLAALCSKHGILLILDDIQMGCGRTGGFFSFEEAGIVPDMVCLSKSISGYGIPMALTLVRPELDIWEPGEHNGTFRGIGPAFITATEAIRAFWSDETLQKSTISKGLKVESHFNRLVADYPEAGLIAKGRGLARGLQFASGDLADQVCAEAFERGLLMETSGPNGEVMKILPALTISDEDLQRGLAIIETCVAAVLEPARKLALA